MQMSHVHVATAFHDFTSKRGFVFASLSVRLYLENVIFFLADDFEIAAALEEEDEVAAAAPAFSSTASSIFSSTLESSMIVVS